MSEKKILSGTDEILSALRERPVFASVPDLADRPFLVRGARMVKDNEKGVRVLKVLLLEGWRSPEEVWTEV